MIQLKTTNNPFGIKENEIALIGTRHENKQLANLDDNDALETNRFRIRSISSEKSHFSKNGNKGELNYFPHRIKF